jgi:hypothetical protein
MPEPSKHRHAKEKAPPRSASAGTIAVVGVGVALLAVVLAVVLVRGHGSSTPETQPPGAIGSATDGGDWHTAGGGHYRISATPLTGTMNTASDSGCIPAPSPGRTNVRFSVQIQNLSSTDAPVPTVAFGANVTSSGTVSKSVRTYAKASKDVELSPQPDARSCTGMAVVHPVGRESISGKGSVTLTGVIGGVRTPITGLALIIRYDVAGASASSGVKHREVVIPFSKITG